ncbi:MAG: hypothetical protein WA584_08950 [Pyrinomonadaceae bacterium]
MKSLRGFLAAIVFLSAFPAAVLCQIIFGVEAEIIVHFVCAVSFALVSFSVFDFNIPGWINWTGSVSAGALALLFLLQGVSPLIQNDSLTYFAFQVLGQWLEARLVDVLLLWFVALLLFDSCGKTRILGFVVMSIVVCVEAYGFYLAYLGTSLNAEAPILKLAFLLPFVWLIFESRKKNSRVEKSNAFTNFAI